MMPKTFTKALFSPDLQKYFYPRTGKICSTVTGETLTELPSPIFEKISWKEATKLSNKFSWVDNDSFRVILDEGIEVEYNIIFEVKEESELDENGKPKLGELKNGKRGPAPTVKKTYWKLENVGFTTVPYYKPDDDVHYHFYEEPNPIDAKNTYKMLTRKYQDYKRATLVRNMNNYECQKQLAIWKQRVVNEGYEDEWSYLEQ